MTLRQRALRARLIIKAKRGKWDSRMCTLHGVSPNVSPPVRRFIRRGYAARLVPTSTVRFPVGAGSYHNARNSQGQGRAGDLGLMPHLIGTQRGRSRMVQFQISEFNRRHRAGHKPHTELIGPDNAHCVLRGRAVTLPEGSALENQHDNHVHGAWA